VIMELIIKNVLKQKRIQGPQVVFVTGPHAFHGGFFSFLDHNNSYSEEELTGPKGGNFTGPSGEKIVKARTKKFIKLKKGYKEIVQSHINVTLNLTRKDRIREESGVRHWTIDIYKTQKTATIKGSCKSHLAKLEEERIIFLNRNGQG